MALPASFKTDGFIHKRKRMRVMIGTEGDTETGKTEFICSAPGPGINICLDRGYEAMLDNPHPPDTRNPDFANIPVAVPMATQYASSGEYIPYWKAFYDLFVKALNNADALTVGLDGDSDSWELQRLAEFGKLTQVPELAYPNVNAARRRMIARAFDSGKNVIATNKLKREYIADPSGALGSDGKPKRIWSGEYERQGFNDQNYLWQIQLRHMFKEAHVNILKKHVPRQYGIKILKCKANSEHVGTELWGRDCNFLSLVSLVYPHVSPEEWGFK